MRGTESRETPNRTSCLVLDPETRVQASACSVFPRFRFHSYSLRSRD
jgi:hypothetical protein